MKPTAMKPARIFFGAIAVVTVSLVLLSWNGKKQAGNYGNNDRDTVPKAKIEKKIVDLDDVMDELNRIDIKEHLEKARVEIQEALKNLDTDKIRMEVDKAMKQLDAVNIEKEIRESLAKVEVREYQEFVDGLEKDGLLNKKENYTIRHKNGELTVNGKKVAAEIYNKYKAFLETHTTITIDKSPGSFSVDDGD